MYQKGKITSPNPMGPRHKYLALVHSPCQTNNTKKLLVPFHTLLEGNNNCLRKAVSQFSFGLLV